MTDTDSATEKVYQALRSKISSGEMEAGSHLGAANIASELDTSRTPVREALNRLAAEGLVEVFQNRGAYVAQWSAKDSEEIFELRILLEGHACSLAAKRITKAQLTELNELSILMEKAATKGVTYDLAELTLCNVRFHKTIIAASGNKRLAALIATVFEFTMQSQTFHQFSQEELQRSMRHHSEIIAALSVGDGDWACSIMRSHIRSARHVFKAPSKIDGQEP